MPVFPGKSPVRMMRFADLEFAPDSNPGTRHKLPNSAGRVTPLNWGPAGRGFQKPASPGQFVMMKC